MRRLEGRLAFEAFLKQGPEGKRRGRFRPLTYTLSAALHVGVAVTALVHGFWHVDELSPPAQAVRLQLSMTAPPPPPHPPPPAAAPKPAREKPAVTSVPKTPATIVQPVEAKPMAPEPSETP